MDGNWEMLPARRVVVPRKEVVVGWWHRALGKKDGRELESRCY